MPPAPFVKKGKIQWCPYKNSLILVMNLINNRKLKRNFKSVMTKGEVFCSNVEQCKKRSLVETIMCYRTAAREMAKFILGRKSSFEQAVQEEKEGFLGDAPDGKFWVCRNDEWQVVEGKKNAVNDIVAFALVIIDRQEGERRPFTKDGMRTPELGLEDAMHNAVLELGDFSGEVG